jgi:ABC-type multidrug transport system ATPase subunit
MEGRTSFIIAHRLSTVRHADQILVVSGGRIVERGTHDELLDEGTVYRQLHEAQTRERKRPRRPADGVAGEPTGEAPGADLEPTEAVTWSQIGEDGD